MNIYKIVPANLFPRKKLKQSIYGNVIIKIDSSNIPKNLQNYQDYSLDEIIEELKKPEWHKIDGWHNIFLWLARQTVGPRI